MRKSVIIDIDGVLRNFIQRHLDIYNETFDEGVKYESINRYDYFALLSEIKHIKPADYFEEHSETLFYKAKPFKRAISSYVNLSRFCDLHLVTSQVPGSEGATVDWVNLYRLPRKTLSFTFEKELIKADIIVEDNPENISAWLDAYPGGQACIIDQPWNKEYKHDSCKRFSSFFAFVVDFIDNRVKEVFSTMENI